MNHGTVLHAIGWLILVLAVATILPWMTALYVGEGQALFAFSFSVLLFGFVGGSLVMAFQDIRRRSTKLELLVLVVASWLIVPLFAAIPIFVADAVPTALDAYFEALSGFTTTGASVVRSLDATARAVIIWRAELQWLGGLATIVMAAVVLAPLGVGGMELRVSPLTRADKSRALDRFRGTAEAVLGLYASFTLACFLMILAGGIPAFDAFCLSLSTVSTGGFSTRDAGLGAFEAPWAMSALVIFMIAGSTNFATHRSAFKNGINEYREDPEISYLLLLAMVGGIFLTVAALQRMGDVPAALGNALFIAVSLISSTGFLPPQPTVISGLSTIFVIGLVLVGGSTLSTAGGIKMMRLALLFKQGDRELKRLSHPHGIIPTQFAGRSVSIQLMKSVWVFVILFLLAFAVTTILLAATGLEPEASLVAAAASLGNAGPAYDLVRLGEGTINTPYADMGWMSKLVLMIAMVVGRLEVLTLLALFGRDQWRQ